MLRHISLEHGLSMPVELIGQGEPVVLLHGFGMDARSWIPFVWPYRRQFQFILPHLRGFGRSARLPMPEADFLSVYVRDLVQLRRQLGLQRYRLGGISMGASTALALHAAGEFTGVSHYLHIDQSPVIHNQPDWPWGSFGTRQAGLFARFAEDLSELTRHAHLPYAHLPEPLRRKLHALRAEFQAETATAPLHQQLARQLPRLFHWLDRLDQPGWASQIRIMQGYLQQGYDFRPSLPRLNVPTTVMIGQHSRVYDLEGQQALVYLLPQAQAVLFPRAGHLIPIEQPIAFTRELGRWLQR